jgi:hypothetical protein
MYSTISLPKALSAVICSDSCRSCRKYRNGLVQITSLLVGRLLWH